MGVSLVPCSYKQECNDDFFVLLICYYSVTQGRDIFIFSCTDGSLSWCKKICLIKLVLKGKTQNTVLDQKPENNHRRCQWKLDLTLYFYLL
jgi:hypothetical protein